MKNFFYVLLCISFCFVACGGDDDPEVSDVLKGKIRGVDFEYGSGRFVNYTDEYSIRIDNKGPMVTDSCETNSDDVYVRFDTEKMTGRRDLFWDLSTGEGITIVFHHPDFFQNLIIDDGGYYEIMSFDENEMKVYIDVTSNSDNFLKGEVTLYNCN